MCLIKQKKNIFFLNLNVLKLLQKLLHLGIDIVFVLNQTG